MIVGNNLSQLAQIKSLDLVLCYNNQQQSQEFNNQLDQNQQQEYYLDQKNQQSPKNHKYRIQNQSKDKKYKESKKITILDQDEQFQKIGQSKLQFIPYESQTNYYNTKFTKYERLLYKEKLELFQPNQYSRHQKIQKKLFDKINDRENKEKENKIKKIDQLQKNVQNINKKNSQEIYKNCSIEQQQNKQDDTNNQGKKLKIQDDQKNEKNEKDINKKQNQKKSQIKLVYDNQKIVLWQRDQLNKQLNSSDVQEKEHSINLYLSQMPKENIEIKIKQNDKIQQTQKNARQNTQHKQNQSSLDQNYNSYKKFKKLKNLQQLNSPDQSCIYLNQNLNHNNSSYSCSPQNRKINALKSKIIIESLTPVNMKQNDMNSTFENHSSQIPYNFQFNDLVKQNSLKEIGNIKQQSQNFKSQNYNENDHVKQDNGVQNIQQFLSQDSQTQKQIENDKDFQVLSTRSQFFQNSLNNKEQKGNQNEVKQQKQNEGENKIRCQINEKKQENNNTESQNQNYNQKMKSKDQFLTFESLQTENFDGFFSNITKRSDYKNKTLNNFNQTARSQFILHNKAHIKYQTIDFKNPFKQAQISIDNKNRRSFNGISQNFYDKIQRNKKIYSSKDDYFNNSSQIKDQFFNTVQQFQLEDSFKQGNESFQQKQGISNFQNVQLQNQNQQNDEKFIDELYYKNFEQKQSYPQDQKQQLELNMEKYCNIKEFLGKVRKNKSRKEGYFNKNYHSVVNSIQKFQQNKKSSYCDIFAKRDSFFSEKSNFEQNEKDQNKQKHKFLGKNIDLQTEFIDGTQLQNQTIVDKMAEQSYKQQNLLQNKLKQTAAIRQVQMYIDEKRADYLQQIEQEKQAILDNIRQTHLQRKMEQQQQEQNKDNKNIKYFHQKVRDQNQNIQKQNSENLEEKIKEFKYKFTRLSEELLNYQENLQAIEDLGQYFNYVKSFQEVVQQKQSELQDLMEFYILTLVERGFYLQYKFLIEKKQNQESEIQDLNQENFLKMVKKNKISLQQQIFEEEQDPLTLEKKVFFYL
ncbi:hypothetical protein PPERSA_07865 [Pseudocohnilembus persalinus]|uniref:Uncharacterized protein n=1 Tax=Pseudocohnilembus persalinus TaxID=266149 RepID=A0A0V0QC06_PSEPJ|nr:hypothetical protein PPERSA_07865 [Pseudocohnilembus persalinus]|eukprot:KRW99788.1 hypothetical protein PPERSA_07865 [Pseudocohnilembus persalinus]